MTRFEFGIPSSDADLDQLADVQTLAFLGNPTDQTRAQRRSRAEPSDHRIVRATGKVVAGLTVYKLAQWFGGQAVPMAGIASVGVDPAHRGSGAGTTLMRSTLESLHEQGAPISTLYPATQPLYRRAGWELAGMYLHYKLETARIDARTREPQLRKIEPGDRDRLVEAFRERARRSAGVLERNDIMWGFRLPGDDPALHGYAVVEDGAVTGFTCYRHRYNDDGGEISCSDLVGLTPTAIARLLSFFADHRSQVGTIIWHGAPADPFALGLGDAAPDIDERDDWMLRIVDVQGALESRGYPAGIDATVHLDVRDDVLGWNDGKFTLEVSGGRGKIKRGGRGRIRIDIRGLAQLYTGYLSPDELRASRYIEGPDKDMAVAASVFAGPTPWLPDYF